MHKSKIEWCDRSWNPITGCLHGCEYCYARGIANRFSGDVRSNLNSPQLDPVGKDLYILENAFETEHDTKLTYPAGFSPTFHRYRLNMPNRVPLPVRVFVGSMCDMFGDWVPDDWIREIFKACEENPRHRYMFLTKNPKRYLDLFEKGLLHLGSNMWYGTTITADDNVGCIRADIMMALKEKGFKTYLSLEPLRGDVSTIIPFQHTADWVIVGAETGNRKGKNVPEKLWINLIVKFCKDNDIPVFLKDNLKNTWNEPLIQKFPQGLKPTPTPRPRHHVRILAVREDKYCSQCQTPLQGKPAVRLGARKYECADCFDKLEAEWKRYEESGVGDE